MSTTVIRNALSTEITAIPSWLGTLLSGQYNNTLCNGATWILVLWRLVHILYSRLMLCCLKQIGTKQYLRARLTDSLWYCGFFIITLAYYLTTLNPNKMDLLRGNHVALRENLPAQVILAYSLICTFYLHTALSEGILHGSLLVFLKFLLLVAVCVSAYVLRLLDIPFTLSAMIAITGLTAELTKIFSCLLSLDNNLKYVFLGGLYFFSLVLFIVSHLVVIPLIFLIPLGKMTLSNISETSSMLLFSSLVLWLCATLYDSILSKSIYHLLYHAKEDLNQEEESEVEEEQEKKKEKMKCSRNIIECSLFPIRTDDAYVLRVVRFEVNERKLKMKAKKKLKSSSMMFIQTLKCMMAIKKKLSQKKKAESSDSDEPSEIEEGREDDKAAADKIVYIDEDSEDDCASKLETEGNKTTATDQEYSNSEDSEARESSCIGEEKAGGAESVKTTSETTIVCNATDAADSKHGETDWIMSEIEGKPLMPASGSDKDLVDVELGTNIEKMDNKTSGSLEEDERGEIEESKSRVKISGSLRKDTDNEESDVKFERKLY